MADVEQPDDPLGFGGIAHKSVHAPAVVEVRRDGEMREQAAVLENIADATAVRRHVDTLRRVEQHESSSVMRPRSGLSSPAIMLTSVVLPAPDAPNSAVTPPPVWKRAAIEKSPSRFSMSTAEHPHSP